MDLINKNFKGKKKKKKRREREEGKNKRKNNPIPSRARLTATLLMPLCQTAELGSVVSAAHPAVKQTGP